jgi:catechol 2,3-dioxygenase-like lactoylglutathione lyase family enzyme
MLDHVGFSVSDMKASRAFYEKAFAPLGIKVMMEITPEMTGGRDSHVGFGIDRADFWIGTGKARVTGVHVAFLATSRENVDSFYKAAMSAGGRDNGPPGVRPHYHENYYGAFVLDPDGNNIEAVCHNPLTDQQP